MCPTITSYLLFFPGAPNSPHFLSRHGGAAAAAVTAGKPEEKKLSPFDKFRNMDNQNSVPTSPIAPG